MEKHFNRAILTQLSLHKKTWSLSEYKKRSHLYMSGAICSESAFKLPKRRSYYSNNLLSIIGLIIAEILIVSEIDCPRKIDRAKCDSGWSTCRIELLFFARNNFLYVDCH